MAATAAWLAGAEALLNRCIDGSEQAAALAQRLDGTSLQIDITGITRIRASAHHGRLSLLNGEAIDGAAHEGAAHEGAAHGGASRGGTADAALSGSLSALLQMLSAGAGSRSRGAVRVQGDAEIAERYRELFVLARPDPEEELSRWIGDFPARRVSQFAQRTFEALRRVRRTAGENIAEYLQEESRDLVTKTELDEFLRGVDDLRETSDRIEARLKRLEGRAKGRA